MDAEVFLEHGAVTRDWRPGGLEQRRRTRVGGRAGRVSCWGEVTPQRPHSHHAEEEAVEEERKGLLRLASYVL